jgi:cyanate permease
MATAVMVAVLVPVALAWIEPPPVRASAAESIEDISQQHLSVPGGVSRVKLLRNLVFWAISIPFALALVAQIAFIVHQIALLEPKIGREAAGFAVSVMTFMAIGGRLGLGMVVDRFDPRLVTAVSLVSQAAALLTILQSDSVPIVLAACAVFGFSVGNIITLPPLIIHREFDAASFVVVMGLSNAISGTVGALGPGLIGLVRSWSGGYDAALMLCIVLELAAAAIMLQRGLSGRRAAVEGRG